MVVEANALGDGAATQRAVLDRHVAHLATADMATGQEDDLGLRERRDQGY